MRKDSSAGSSVIAILLAVVVFLGSLGFLMFQTQQAAPDAESELRSSSYQREAHDLARVLLSSPGYMDDGTDWILLDGTTVTDQVSRLGLRDMDSRHLNFSKFDNLRRAPLVADPDIGGYFIYEDARRSLGLTEAGLDFHIRSYPNLQSIRDVLSKGFKDENMRVTYIGDYERVTGGGGGDPGEGLVVGDLHCSESPAYGADPALSWRLNFTLTNGGSEPTQFQAHFNIDFNGDGAVVHQDAGTSFIVPVGADTDIYVDVPRKSGRTCGASTLVDLEVFDTSAMLLDLEGLALDKISDDPGTTSKDLIADSHKQHFKYDDRVRVNYRGDVANGDALTLDFLAEDDGGVVLTKLHTVPSNPNQHFIRLAKEELPPGNYTAILHRDDAPKVRATERILVLEDGQSVPEYVPPSGAGTDEPQEPVGHEVAFLESLIQNFCPYRFSSTTESPMPSAPAWSDRCDFKDGQAQTGDVFPDLKKALDNDLPGRLLNPDGTPNYDIVDTLVVGSHVSHNAMTSGAAKHAVRDWVLGGGTLIVFGSDAQNVQWLQPLFHSGIHSSSGGINTPDESHPMLHTPDSLDHRAYDNRDQAWKLTAGADEHFTMVVEQDDLPVTAVSDPGAFGDGTIILTTWLPYDLFGDGAGSSELEGLKLVNNFVTISYRTLYLDYGPPLPRDVAVVPALEKPLILHPKLGLVSMDVVVYVFPR